MLFTMYALLRKGKHDFFEIPTLTGKSNLYSVTVGFTESCRYKLPPVDQLDWNKLFGFTNGFSFGRMNGRKNWGFQNSCRWAWRYNPEIDKIELGYYLHHKGYLVYDKLMEVEIGQRVTLDIWFYKDEYKFIGYIPGKSFKVFSFKHDLGKNLGISQGLYFGGNQKAPQDIKLFILKGKYTKWHWN